MAPGPGAAPGTRRDRGAELCGGRVTLEPGRRTQVTSRRHSHPRGTSARCHTAGRTQRGAATRERDAKRSPASALGPAVEGHVGTDRRAPPSSALTGTTGSEASPNGTTLKITYGGNTLTVNLQTQTPAKRGRSCRGNRTSQSQHVRPRGRARTGVFRYDETRDGHSCSRVFARQHRGPPAIGPCL